MQLILTNTPDSSTGALRLAHLEALKEQDGKPVLQSLIYSDPFFHEFLAGLSSKEAIQGTQAALSKAALTITRLESTPAPASSSRELEQSGSVVDSVGGVSVYRPCPREPLLHPH